jgi:predicted  nucleic acid-binding Zn-ribbon protein
MTEDNISNLILDHLRSIRSTLARHDEQFDTLIMRLGSIESQMAGIHADIAGLNLRMDRFENRLARIERRLELRDETA